MLILLSPFSEDTVKTEAESLSEILETNQTTWYHLEEYSVAWASL
jgi:hypothetical protein